MAENVPPEIPKLFTEVEKAMKEYRKWHEIQLCWFFLIFPSFMVGSKQIKLADCLKRLGRALVHKQLIEAAKVIHTTGVFRKTILGGIFVTYVERDTWIKIKGYAEEINTYFATQNIAANFLEEVYKYNCFRRGS